MKLPLIASAMFSLVFSTAALAQNSNQRPGPKYRTQSYSERMMLKSMEPKSSIGYFIEPVLGMNLSTLDGVENGASAENMTAFQAGVGFLIGKDNIWLDSGLLYAERGSQISGIRMMDGNLMSIKLNFKYLEVPLLARYTFQNPRDSHVFVRAGVVAGLLQDGKMTITDFNGMPMYSHSESSVKDDFNSLDLRILAGAGGAFRVSGNISLLMQLDYQRSVTKINKGSFANGLDLMSSSFNGLLGLSIKI